MLLVYSRLNTSVCIRFWSQSRPWRSSKNQPPAIVPCCKIALPLLYSTNTLQFFFLSVAACWALSFSLGTPTCSLNISVMVELLARKLTLNARPKIAAAVYRAVVLKSTNER